MTTIDPNPTHEATGEYRARFDRRAFGYSKPWYIIAPDGTEHPGNYTEAEARAEVERLNAEDRLARREDA